jgi:DDE superfamily endonuclease
MKKTVNEDDEARYYTCKTFDSHFFLSNVSTMPRRAREDYDDESEDGIDVEQGTGSGILAPTGMSIRRTRRRTNWLHRASDSICVAHMFHGNMLYHLACNLGNWAVFFIYTYMMIHASFDQIRSIDELFQLPWQALDGIRMMANYSYVVMLLYWHDLVDIMFFPNSNRDNAPGVAERFPARNTTIDELSDQQAEDLTGFNKAQLHLLVVAWRLPEILRPPPGQRRTFFPREEALIKFLNWLRHGHTFIHMAAYVFGGDPRIYTFIMRCMVSHLYTTFYHKVSGDSLRMWMPYLDVFRGAILLHLRNQAQIDVLSNIPGLAAEAAAFLQSLPETFRIFGFVDDYGVQTAAPGYSARRHQDFLHDIQRAYYSGYFRFHGLKAQVVFLPNGMVGSVFVASLAHNDRGMVNLSGLNEYLLSLLQGRGLPPNGILLPALYADGIFTLSETIIPRFTGQNLTDFHRRLNTRMSGSRISIEHCLGFHNNLFKLFRTPELLSLFMNGEHVHNLVLVSFFVLNCYFCLNQSASAMFSVQAPTLDQYIPLSEILVPAPFVEDWELGETYVYN